MKFEYKEEEKHYYKIINYEKILVQRDFSETANRGKDYAVQLPKN